MKISDSNLLNARHRTYEVIMRLRQMPDMKSNVDDLEFVCDILDGIIDGYLEAN